MTHNYILKIYLYGVNTTTYNLFVKIIKFIKDICVPQ